MFCFSTEVIVFLSGALALFLWSTCMPLFCVFSLKYVRTSRCAGGVQTLIHIIYFDLDGCGGDFHVVYVSGSLPFCKVTSTRVCVSGG